MIVRNPVLKGSSLQSWYRRILIPVASAAMMFPIHQSLAATLPVSPSLTLAWNPVPETNIQGYRLYGGTVSKQYSLLYEAGNVNRFTVNGLALGETYYFSVKAIGSTGLEGPLSDELVVAFNPQPEAIADAYSVEQNTQLVVPANGVLKNDTDLDSVVLHAMLDSGPLHGNLTLQADGGFTYTPHPGFTGGDSFTYHASDGYFDSESTSVSIAVNEPVFELLSNGSFESGYTGWSAAGNQKVETAVSPLAPSGGARLVAFNSSNLSPNGTLSQSFATVAGVSYTLEFDMSVISYNENSQSLQVNVNGRSSLLSQLITLNGNGVGVIPWRSYRFTFVADGDTSTLTFRDVSLSSTSIDLLLDNVSVSGPKGYPQIPTLPEGHGTPSLAGRPGGIIVAMTVTAAGSYVLQRSENLVTWEVVGTTTAAGPGKISFLDSKPPVSSQTKMFYRIGLPTVIGGGNQGGSTYPKIPTLLEGRSTPSLAGRPGEITVAMTVTAAGTYVLQRSENLVTWEIVGTTTAVGPGQISFLDLKPPVGSQTKMFYRIKRP